MVPIVTPATDTDEIIFIAFLDFFAKRYLFAIYRESFTFYLPAITSKPVPDLWIIETSRKLRNNATGKMMR
jgi:hypothetical protein